MLKAGEKGKLYTDAGLVSLYTDPGSVSLEVLNECEVKIVQRLRRTYNSSMVLIYKGALSNM